MPHVESDVQETALPRPNGATVAGHAVDIDVLVVGLGPVGAALANLLGRYGVRVLAVDRSSEIFTKPRAIALDNEALRILQLAGVRDGEFATVALPQVQYHSPLFGPFARINSARIVDGHPMLVTFYQPELEQLLRSKLAQYPNVEVLDEALLPRRAPLGWAVIVRPDRCVLAEGPVEQVETLLEQALARIAPATGSAGAPDAAWNPLSTTHAA